MQQSPMLWTGHARGSMAIFYPNMNQRTGTDSWQAQNRYAVVNPSHSADRSRRAESKSASIRRPVRIYPESADLHSA
jgi:hypothetical protein